MLQDQIAYWVSRLDAQRRLKGQTALPGDECHGGGADHGDGQRPAGPFARLGKCEEQGEQCSQGDADHGSVNHQRMERQIPDLVEHESPGARWPAHLAPIDQTPAHTVTRRAQRNGSMTRSSPPRVYATAPRAVRRSATSPANAALRSSPLARS